MRAESGVFPWAKKTVRSLAPGALRPLRAVVVAPHPDDETIGAGAMLRELAPSAVVFATDGAPRDRGLWPEELAHLAREDYAALRWREALSALAIAGIPSVRTRRLGHVDQEAFRTMPAIAQAIVGVLVETAADALVAPPYEGGHPDHDAVAFAAHAAVALVRQAGGDVPVVYEAATYHGDGGRLVAAEFLGDDGPVWTYALEGDARVRKERMLSCYRSQARVLEAFPRDVERFRPAPSYDFTRAPHEGKLRYEQLGWPISGAAWREHARAALRELGFAEGACL